MPGIAGLISRQPSDTCQRLVEQMIATMRHEKFYESGTYSAPELGIFGGWTALEGSFADCQPIRSERDDIALLFSGECFSDRETRAQLKHRGHRFDDGTAPWLVTPYEEEGDAFTEQLTCLFRGRPIDRRPSPPTPFDDGFGIERL